MARNMLLILCFNGLEGTDGHAELLALLQIGQQQTGRARRRCRHVSSASPNVASWRAREIPSVDAALPGSPSASVVRDEDAVESGFGQGAAGVERMHRCQAGLGGGHDERADALAGPGDDHDVGRALGGEDGELPARQGPARRRPARRSW